MTSRKPLIFLSVCMRERERENISQSLKETIEHMNQTTPILHMHKLQAQGVCVCVCEFHFHIQMGTLQKKQKGKKFFSHSNQKIQNLTYKYNTFICKTPFPIQQLSNFFCMQKQQISQIPLLSYTASTM